MWCCFQMQERVLCEGLLILKQCTIYTLCRDTCQGSESNNLENALHWKQSSEDNVEILQHRVIRVRRLVKLKGKENYLFWTDSHPCILHCYKWGMKRALADQPSSWGPRCWERSWSWWSTQRVARPQTSTSGTGRTVGSVAYSGSAAWHWWQSRCRPSENQQIDKTQTMSNIHITAIQSNLWRKAQMDW